MVSALWLIWKRWRTAPAPAQKTGPHRTRQACTESGHGIAPQSAATNTRAAESRRHPLCTAQGTISAQKKIGSSARPICSRSFVPPAISKPKAMVMPLQWALPGTLPDCKGAPIWFEGPCRARSAEGKIPSAGPARLHSDRFRHDPR